MRYNTIKVATGHVRVPGSGSDLATTRATREPRDNPLKLVLYSDPPAPGELPVAAVLCPSSALRARSSPLVFSTFSLHGRTLK